MSETHAEMEAEQEHEHFEAQTAFFNLFRTASKKDILIAWRRLCEMLGYMHATQAEGSSQKSTSLLDDLTFEGFNAATDKLVKKDQYFLNENLAIEELGFSVVNIEVNTSATAGEYALNLTNLRSKSKREGMTRAVRDNIIKEMRKLCNFWSNHLNKPTKNRSPSESSGTQNPFDILFEVLKDSFDDKETELLAEHQAIWEKETPEQRSKHRTGYLLKATYPDYESKLISYLPPSFFVFMFLGPPAGDKCFHTFKLGINQNADGSNHGMDPGNSNNKSGKRGENSRNGAKEEIHQTRSGDVLSWKHDKSLENEAKALDIDEERLQLEREQFQATDSSNMVSVSLHVRTLVIFHNGYNDFACRI